MSAKVMHPGRLKKHREARKLKIEEEEAMKKRKHDFILKLRKSLLGGRDESTQLGVGSVLGE